MRRDSTSAARDSDVAVLTQLLERMLVDVARLGYGDDVDFDYVAPELAAELQRLYPEGLPAGWTVEADFRDCAEVHARLPDGDEAPLRTVADVVVDDRSVIRSPAGAVTPSPPRRYLLVVTVDLDRRRITDLRCRETRV
jgi:hypothetical protein